MSKVDAPAPEPMDNTHKKAPVRPRGKYIDFVPRKKTRPAIPQTPKLSVVEVTTETVVKPKATAPEVTPLEETAVIPDEELLSVEELSPSEESLPSEGLPSDEEPLFEETPSDTEPEPLFEDQSNEMAPEPEPAAELPEEPIAATLSEDPEIIIEDTSVLSDLDRELLEFEDALKDFAEEPSEDLEGDLENAIIEEEQTDFVAEVNADEYVATIAGVTTKTTVKDPPFLKDYHIEKRPLSDHTPETPPPLRADTIESTEHPEFNEEEFVERLDKAPEPKAVVTDTEKSGSKIGMLLTILITVLLGAGVGVFIYLAFFQKS